MLIPHIIITVVHIKVLKEQLHTSSIETIKALRAILHQYSEKFRESYAFGYVPHMYNYGWWHAFIVVPPALLLDFVNFDRLAA
jgi:hypothetical protein